jgi:hypothetical protein
MAAGISTLPKLLVATIAAAALIALPSQGGAGVVRVDTEFASANMLVTDEAGCVESSLGLFALDQRNRPRQDGVASAVQLFVNLTKYDACSGTLLFSSFAVRDLTASELDISAQARTARLQTTLDLVDNVDSGSSLTLALDLAWTAEGQPALRSREMSRTTGGGFQLIVARNRFEQGDAVLSGSASDGTVEYTKGDLLFVQTGDSRSHTLTVPEAITAALAAQEQAAGGKPSSSKIDQRFTVSIWESFENGGCVRNLGIVVFDELSDEAGPHTNAFIDFSRFDHCQNVPLFWVTTDSLVPTEPEAFRMSRKLDDVDLDASLAGLDRVSGTAVTLTVDLHLDGVGEIAVNDTKSKLVENGVKTDARFAGRSRSATITGSVTDGTHDLLAGLPVGPEDLISAGFGESQTTIKVH